MTDVTYHRIRAAAIRPGMRVARARTHTFRHVAGVYPHDHSVWIEYCAGGRDRPQLDALWWQEVEHLSEYRNRTCNNAP